MLTIKKKVKLEKDTIKTKISFVYSKNTQRGILDYECIYEKILYFSKLYSMCIIVSSEANQPTCLNGFKQQSFLFFAHISVIHLGVR